MSTTTNDSAITIDSATTNPLISNAIDNNEISITGNNNSSSLLLMSGNHSEDAKSNFDLNFLSKFLEKMQLYIFKNPFGMTNPLFKKIALSLIYLGLIFSLMQFFNPKNNQSMFELYAICFWIVSMIISIWIIDPYNANNIEYNMPTIP